VKRDTRDTADTRYTWHFTVIDRWAKSKAALDQGDSLTGVASAQRSNDQSSYRAFGSAETKRDMIANAPLTAVFLILFYKPK
jgi:hypothetical protein